MKIKLGLGSKHAYTLGMLVSLFLGAFLYHITFNVPVEFFRSPLEAAYAKAFCSLLLGVCMSSSILLVVETLTRFGFLPVFKPSARPQKKSKSLLKTMRALFERPAKTRAKRISEEFPVSFVSKNKRMRSLAEKMALDMADDVLEAGRVLSPYRLVAKNLFYALILLFVSVPLGIFLSVFIHPALLAVAVLPAVPFFYPKLKLRSAVGDRKRSLEDEVPFFTIYASILQNVGVSVYNSLLLLIGRGVFRQVETDALMVKRNVEFFFKSSLEALEELGRIHPNEKMKTLLLGYTSEWRSGGDMASYLEAKAEDYLADMRFRWQSYAGRASDIGEAVISLFFIFPMVVLTSAFVFPEQAMSTISIILSLVIPVLTTVVFGIIHTTQPKNYDVIGGNMWLSLAAGVASLLATFFAGSPLWLCIAASLAAACTLYGGSVILQMKEIDMQEKALPQFIRDITEFKKMGYDINMAIRRIAKENTYNPSFDPLIQSLAKQLELGVRVSEIKIPSRSWFTQMSFFLLSEVVESGGGTARCLEMLTGFVNQAVRVKNETRASMRLYQFLSLFTPIGLSLTVALMVSMMMIFASTLMPAVELGVLGLLVEMPKELVEMSYVFVMISSVCVALLSSKAISFTMKNTLWITFNVCLAATGIAFTDPIAKMLVESFLAPS